MKPVIYGGLGVEQPMPPTDTVVVRCVDWLRRQKRPISEEMWQAIVKIAESPKTPRRTRLRAWAMIADRVDPLPARETVAVTAHGPLIVTWQETPAASRSRTLPGRSNGHSTTPSKPIILEHRSSSATDDLASL